MSDDTHRVVHKYWRWGDEVYEPGDTVTPPETALENHADRFERIDAEDGGEEPDSEDETPGVDAEEPASSKPNIAEMTVDDVRNWASNQTDLETVEAALEQERARDDPRSTAIDVLDRRVNALTDEEE